MKSKDFFGILRSLVFIPGFFEILVFIYYYYRLNDLSSDDVFVVVVVGILLMMISFVAICMQLTKGSSVNDVTVSGRGSMFLRRQY